MESLDAVLNNALVLPTKQPVCRRSVEEVVFASTFPDKMPRVLWIHTDGAAAMLVCCVESASQTARCPILPILD